MELLYCILIVWWLIFWKPSKVMKAATSNTSIPVYTKYHHTNTSTLQLRGSPAGERNVLDATADHIALGHGDDVSHAVSSVDYGARQSALAGLKRQQETTK